MFTIICFACSVVTTVLSRSKNSVVLKKNIGFSVFLLQNKFLSIIIMAEFER